LIDKVKPLCCKYHRKTKAFRDKLMQRSQAAFFNFVPSVAKVRIYATPPALEAIMPVCFLTDEQHQNYGCYAFAEEDLNHIGLTRFSVPLIPKPLLSVV
jgi:hypothetical protein